MIGPKVLKFLGFDWGCPGVVLREGEDRSKTLPVGLFSRNVLIVVTTLMPSKLPYLL